MLSSLAQLAESASNHISSASPDSMSAAANKTTEHQQRYYFRMLYNVLDETDDILLMVDARDSARCRSRLVAVEEAGGTQVQSGGQSDTVSFLLLNKSVREPHTFSSFSSPGDY